MGENEDTQEIVIQEHSTSGLYYRYKKRDDDEIRKFLENCKIVKLTNNGVGTIQGYYPLSDESMKAILPKPRGKSLTFDATEIAGEPLTGLRQFKEVTFLVKNNSRFFLKPDIGEIIDQLSFDDFNSSHVRAILFQPKEYVGLPHTDGEHFEMKAILLVDENTHSHFTYNAGWICSTINREN